MTSALGPPCQQGVVPFPVESEKIAYDSLLIIFTAVITEGYAHVFRSLSTLALVSKSWKQTADCLEIGRCLFNHMGWRFPKEPQIWKTAYRLQSGNLFINHPDLKPTVTTIAYPPIAMMHQQRWAWIEDKGFIYYRHGGLEFHVCLFDNPNDILKIATEAGITALSVFKDHVACGMQSGKIASYHLETLKPYASYPAHAAKDTIREIFETQDSWISVSNTEIVRYDPSTSQTQCLLKNYNPHIKEQIYPSVHCINEYLFFKFDPAEEIAISPIHYYMYSLRHPYGLEEISGPKHFSMRQTHPWGDQIAAISYQSKPDYTGNKYNQTLDTFTICRFPFDPLSFYRGEPEMNTISPVGSSCGQTVTVTHWKKRMFECWQFHFRGDAAFIIWDDYESPEVKTSLYHIELINLKNEGSIIFTHCDPNIDIYKATIANNKFIYLQTRLSQVVILDFPINPSITKS